MSIFVNIFVFVILVNIYIFAESLLKWIKERGNRNDILNSQVLLITNHVRTFLNVKLCDIQQPIIYFKLIASWYINIPLTCFCEKVNSVQKLQNEHMWSGAPAKVLIYVTHIQNSQKKLNSDLPFWNLYCNTVESLVRPKICKLPLRKNSERQTFVNTKIFFLLILPIHCGCQYKYLTSCITLSG